MLGIDSPCFRVTVTIDRHIASTVVVLEPVTRDAEFTPLAKLTPGLGAKLVRCVGSDDTFTVWPGGDDEQNDPGC